MSRPFQPDGKWEKIVVIFAVVVFCNGGGGGGGDTYPQNVHNVSLPHCKIMCQTNE